MKNEIRIYFFITFLSLFISSIFKNILNFFSFLSFDNVMIGGNIFETPITLAPFLINQ